MPGSLLILLSVFFCSLVFQFGLASGNGTVYNFRNGLIYNFTTVITSCDVKLSGTCVSPVPYLWLDENDSFALGLVRKNPEAYILSVFLDMPGGVSGAWIDVVWSANRYDPVKTNATLSFVQNGSLVLRDADGRQVWSTNTDGLGAVGIYMNTTSGNLIIYGNDNVTLWQSFDSVTDSLLQGQTLKTGMKLVSNSSSTNASEGSYSLVVEAGGVALYGSFPDPQAYWLWGYYGQNDTTSIMQTCQYPTYLGFFTSNVQMYQEESYQYDNISFSSTSISTRLCDFSSSDNLVYASDRENYHSRWLRLESDGNLRMYAVLNTQSVSIDYDFFENMKCSLPQICGPYGICSSNGQCGCPDDSQNLASNASFSFINKNSPAQGCKYSKGLTSCSAPGENHLVLVNAVDYYWIQYTSLQNITTTSAAKCQNTCLENCSCTASFFNEEIGACYTITQHLQSMRSISTANSSFSAYVKVAGPNLSPGKSNSRNNTAIIVSLVIVGCALVFVIWAVVAYRRKQARSRRKSEDDDFLETLPGLPPRFSTRELQSATLGFSKKLGAGGFGTVYEGVLPDGSKVAVKKLDGDGARQGRKEFRAEVATIGSIHHLNLVRLRGFCAEGMDHMLVYEFMYNGSLDRWIFSTNSQDHSLDWDTRFKIALGTARGLHYLHEECRERIIHLDIKPENILLDENFLPKVSDFGMSKLVDREQHSMVMTRMRGTPGYLAPEWLVHAAVTSKADVYSYGMVLLEIVAGRRSLDLRCEDAEKRFLPAWGISLLETGRQQELVDSRLYTNFDKGEMTRVIYIAFACVQHEPEARPAMSTVVQMLEGLVDVPVPDLWSRQLSDIKNLAREFSASSATSSHPLSAGHSNWSAQNLSQPR